MADIPHNLSLDQCLAPSYANYPRLSMDAFYDRLLKAFVAPKCVEAADKMRVSLRKSGKSKKPEETVTADSEADTCRFLCEKAKSGLSRCRKCGQSIEKGSIRFGYPSPDPRGEYGAIPIWFHIRCTPLSFIGYEVFNEQLQSLCEGFLQLDEEVRQEAISVCGKSLNEYANDFDDSARLVERRGVSVPLLDKPAGLSTEVVLLGYQLEGYSWMMAQEENNSTKGGILADEMGMGKTLQAILLILAKRDLVRPTLVVCPVAAVMQWYSEIEKFVSNEKPLSVHVYHGSGKIGAADLAAFDVVLTTYQTLENEYRKEANKAKVKCKYCHKMFLPGKLSFHLKYMCGPNAMRTAKQSLQKTKHKVAAETAKKSMGIAAPTPSNILREVMVAGGHVEMKDVENLNQYQLMRKMRNSVTVQQVAQGVPVMQQVDHSLPVIEQADQSVTEDMTAAQAKSAQSVPESMTVAQIKDSLKLRGIATTGVTRKADLLALLTSNTKPAGRAKRTRKSIAPSESSDETIQVDSDESYSESEDVDSEESSDSESESVDSEESSEIDSPVKKIRSKNVGSKKNGDSENEVEDIDLGLSALHSVQWGRLVLDEAHRIKAHTNSTSMAAFAIAAEYRWCLSGTPLQNRVGELYSLVRFLRFAPFAHYFCKGCDCKSLHFRFEDNKFCRKCGCARTRHYSYFKQVISGPIVKFGLGDGVALNILKSQVLDSILLRRTKIERQADLNLPPMSVEIRKIKLSAAELDFYESVFKQSVLQFDTFAQSGTLLHNYAHIFDLLTRLRQALDHPYLITFGADYSGKPQGEEQRGICALCQDDIGTEEASAEANCSHKFHADCVKEYIREAPEINTGCPACFVPLTLKFNETANSQPGSEEETAASTPAAKISKTKKDTILERVGAARFESSTKIEAVVNEVVKLEKTESKILIFSQFTRMLDLVEFRMKQNGIGCAKLTGALNLGQRSSIILAFNTDPSMKALLISLKAGGEGLNLQVADHVFLLDPWWNPACELQAIQRAHRIGQTRPVKAVRIVTENTVEEKVVALQEMKQLVFDATVGQSQGAEKKLTESDLRFLFNH